MLFKSNQSIKRLTSLSTWSRTLNLKSNELGVTLAFVDSGKVGIGNVTSTKWDISLELLLVIRTMTLVPSQAHRVVIRVGHLQTNIVFLISVCDLRIVIHEFSNANLIDFLKETSLEISLLLSLSLLCLSLLFQIEVLEIHIAHLVVILIRHGKPWVSKQGFCRGTFGRFPLQDRQ